MAIEAINYPIFALQYSPEMYILDLPDHNEHTDMISRTFSQLLYNYAAKNRNKVIPQHYELINKQMTLDREDPVNCPMTVIEQDKSISQYNLRAFYYKFIEYDSKSRTPVTVLSEPSKPPRPSKSISITNLDLPEKSYSKHVATPSMEHVQASPSKRYLPDQSN